MLPPCGYSFDVGVDANNFTPVSIEEVEQRMKTLTPNDYDKKSGELDPEEL
jgi:calcineurin-like phosphoesterase family protein